MKISPVAGAITLALAVGITGAWIRSALTVKPTAVVTPSPIKGDREPPPSPSPTPPPSPAPTATEKCNVVALKATIKQKDFDWLKTQPRGAKAKPIQSRLGQPTCNLVRLDPGTTARAGYRAAWDPGTLIVVAYNGGFYKEWQQLQQAHKP